MKDPAKFLAMRAGAYQAYYENMPLRHTSLAASGPMRSSIGSNRSVSWRSSWCSMAANIARRSRTTTRRANLNKAARSPKNTMLGKRQFAWVKDSLGDSTATWNVLANQVIMAIIDIKKGPEQLYPMDEWTRLRARAQQAHEVHRGAKNRQHDRADRRQPCELGQRSAGRRLADENARRRHGVCRHEHLQRRKRQRAITNGPKK